MFFRGFLPLLALALSSLAQTTFEYWPGAKYNPAIPTIKSVLGYEPGERITSHAGLMTYLEARTQAFGIKRRHGTPHGNPAMSRS